MVSRVTLATMEAAAIDRHFASPLTIARLAHVEPGRHLVAVDEDQPGRALELSHRVGHRPQRGIQDVFAVDAIDAGDADADARMCQDLAIERSADVGFQNLRIRDAVRNVAGIEDDGGGYDRSGQRAAPSLIHPGHRPAVDIKLNRFQLECRLHAANCLPLSRELRVRGRTCQRDRRGPFDYKSGF